MVDRRPDDFGVPGDSLHDRVAAHEPIRIVTVVREAGQAAQPVRGDEGKGVPAVLPAAAEGRAPLEDDVLASGALQVPAHDQSRLTGTDHDRVDRARWIAAHRTEYGRWRACDHAAMRPMGTTRRRLPGPILAATVALGTLGACQSLSGMAALVDETPTACPAALLQGDLVRTPDGSLGVLVPGGPMYRVHWTSYVIGSGPPATLVNDNGLVVATEGERVGVAGGDLGKQPLEWLECGGLAPLVG
jgi:hypothetical protein